jgi:hypothetical protein
VNRLGTYLEISAKELRAGDILMEEHKHGAFHAFSVDSAEQRGCNVVVSFVAGFPAPDWDVYKLDDPLRVIRCCSPEDRR